MPARTVVATALAAGIAIAGFRFAFIPLLFSDRSALETELSTFSDRWTPTYPQFLSEVQSRTSPGDTIVILVPMRRWDDGYAYAYYRASFFLTGRTVLPMVWRDDSLQRNNLERAGWIAVWNMNARIDGFDEVWRGDSGALYQRAGRR